MTEKPKHREAARKGTKPIGQILVDLELEAKGKFAKDEGPIQSNLEEAEKKPADDR